MWRSRLTAIGFGLVGVLIGLLLWHLYTDHLAFHAIVEFINRNGDKIQRLP